MFFWVGVVWCAGDVGAGRLAGSESHVGRLRVLVVLAFGQRQAAKRIQFPTLRFAPEQPDVGHSVLIDRNAIGLGLPFSHNGSSPSPLFPLARSSPMTRSHPAQMSTKPSYAALCTHVTSDSRHPIQWTQHAHILAGRQVRGEKGLRGMVTPNYMAWHRQDHRAHLPLTIRPGGRHSWRSNATSKLNLEAEWSSGRDKSQPRGPSAEIVHKQARKYAQALTPSRFPGIHSLVWRMGFAVCHMLATFPRPPPQPCAATPSGTLE